ncbi:putative mucin/carbohydrate-binding domain-containing protein [Bacillus toyonensis]|uniref:putative mucin/carbohydrate-binding domain-containing protein n=1 Tax=Bacillus toyonensis TaxID=155322 RepID=UPI00268E6C8F
MPFVNTPYGTTNAKLEYQMESDQVQKPLPVYQERGNVEQFFQTWDQYDGDYALIKGKNFQLFVPKRDKGLIKNLKDFKSLDELIAYLDEVFAFNNQIIGLDNSTPTDKLSENRYFLKADSHGAGGAYYGTHWTANSYATTDMWIEKVSWGMLHEIAHGYQAGFEGQGMYTGEVSNNLFAVQYQYEKYGKKADQIGWLFDYGKKDKVEKNLYSALIKNNGSYDSVDLREKLILLTMLKQKAGDEAFTKMYQGYRKEANQAGFRKDGYHLPDLINHYYSENSGYDFTPALQSWKLSLDPLQAELNRAKGYQAVVSLAGIVPESHLPQARSLINRNILINSNFEMVKNAEIAPLQLKGNLKIQLNTKDIESFKGETIQLKEGKTVIKELPIEGKTISFTDVPNGIYTLTIPNGKNGKYQMDQYYAYVKEKENTLNVKLEKIETSNLTDQKIRFLGLGDSEFAVFQTNLNSHHATFNIIKDKPHSYYEGEKYASLQLTDDKGKVIYNKELLGTNVVTGKDTIPFEIGYKITIYHDEVDKNRLINSEKLIDSKNKTYTFIMTKWGLKNITLDNNTEENIMKKIDARAKEILHNQDLMSMKQSEIKNHLWIAIDSLTEPYRTNYFNKYQEIFDSSKPIDGVLEGK